MPVEYERLPGKPVTLDRCPSCGMWPFFPFLRGQVQSSWRKLLRRPYCCLICEHCKEVVGYEKP